MSKEVATDKKPSSGKKKFLAFLAAMVATGVSVLGVYGATELYDSFFKRYDRPDYALTAGIRQLSQTSLVRQETSFLSDGVRLVGYYYPAENEKGLVVFSHGLHAGADDYLTIIEYMVGSGYGVFAYNYKGTYESGGSSTVGMCESLVDLDHAIDFVKKDGRFSGKKLFLLGHSWGAYATAAVLALQKNIRAAACIAPFNSGYTLIEEKAEQFAGEKANGGVPKAILGAYQKYLFGKYTEYSGVRGINSVDIPVVIAHGKSDRVISYRLQAISAHKKEIKNKKTIFYDGVGAHDGHDSVYLSEAAVRYREEVKAALKKLGSGKEEPSYEEKAAFYQTIDDRLYSEVNEELFSLIVRTFDWA